MIIQPFKVISRAKTYDLVDRDALDSEETKRSVNKMQVDALAYAQEGAKCKGRGLADRQDLDNLVFAVFDGGDLLGIFMLGCIAYVSGPWGNLQRWNVVDPGADVIFDAVPMPGVLGMALDVEEDFASDIFGLLVKPELGLLSGQGLAVGFNKLHYGIFKDHDDPISTRVQGQHAKVQLNPSLLVTETPHPTVAHLTVAEVRSQ